MALFLSALMLVSAIPMSIFAEEKSNSASDLYESLSISGDLKAIDNYYINEPFVEIPITPEILDDIDNNKVLESIDLLSDDLNAIDKVNYVYNSNIKYELEYDGGAIVSCDENMEVLAYSNFDRNTDIGQLNLSCQTSTIDNLDNTEEINELKSKYNIDDTYKLEITEDNNDIKYYWSKIGYNGILNPYDSLSIRFDCASGVIVTFNRFADVFKNTDINISKEDAEKIALSSNEDFVSVSSCEMYYEKPNFFWNDTNKIYTTDSTVRLVYKVIIDDIYEVWVDAETGKIIGGDIMKAANNARAYAYSNFSYATQSASLANTYLKKLGYTSSSGVINNNFTTNPVLPFVRDDLNAYGFYIDCHGSTTTLATDNKTILTTSQVKGNWHFVFLDACSTAANTNWANAFKISSSYSKRAFLGWSNTVTTKNAYSFCSYFWPETYNGNHSNNIRDAAVWAADQVPGSGTTPIKFYGDKSYNGKAY